MEQLNLTFSDEKEVHFLINNAGVMRDSSKKQLTEDGFEIQMGVNHLGRRMCLVDKLDQLI